MPDPVPIPSLPVLPYAVPPHLRGIVVEERDDKLCILIREAGRVWPKSWSWVGNGLAEVSWLILLGLVVLAWLNWLLFLCVVAALVVSAIILVYWAYARRQPAAIELSATKLAISNVDPKYGRDEEWERTSIYAIKYVGHAGKWMIRAHMKEIYSFQLVSDAATMRQLAELLRQRLGLSTDAPPEG